MFAQNNNVIENYSQALKTWKSSHQRSSIKRAVLNNFAISTGKHLCWSPFCSSFLLKETPKQIFSCKYCEIFKNTYFEEHLQKAASRYGGKIGFVLVSFVQVKVAAKNAN